MLFIFQTCRFISYSFIRNCSISSISYYSWSIDSYLSNYSIDFTLHRKDYFTVKIPVVVLISSVCAYPAYYLQDNNKDSVSMQSGGCQKTERENIAVVYYLQCSNHSFVKQFCQKNICARSCPLSPLWFKYRSKNEDPGLKVNPL